jgi:hypothetical protein
MTFFILQKSGDALLQEQGDNLLLEHDTTPPEVVSIADDVSGGPVTTGDPIEFTITFDEDIDDTTVSVADFENTGTATVTIDSVSTVSPTVQNVLITTTSAGTVIFGIKSAATIADMTGNFLVGPVVDDTEITVNDPDLTPPTVSSITDNRGGGPVAVGQTITYTITFDEDIDHTTVSAADFDNAGTSAITIGTITETAAGVFTVVVTPTDEGTVILRIKGTAVIDDLAGNSLVVPVEDPTEITVNAAPATPEEWYYLMY